MKSLFVALVTMGIAVPVAVAQPQSPATETTRSGSLNWLNQDATQDKKSGGAIGSDSAKVDVGSAVPAGPAPASSTCGIAPAQPNSPGSASVQSLGAKCPEGKTE